MGCGCKDSKYVYVVRKLVLILGREVEKPVERGLCRSCLVGR
jgi:hypothetical protein